MYAFEAVGETSLVAPMAPVRQWLEVVVRDERIDLDVVGCCPPWPSNSQALSLQGWGDIEDDWLTEVAEVKFCYVRRGDVLTPLLREGLYTGVRILAEFWAGLDYTSHKPWEPTHLLRVRELTRRYPSVAGWAADPVGLRFSTTFDAETWVRIQGKG